jgi:hypothetical protein
MKRFTIASALCAACAVFSVHGEVHAQAGAAKEVTGPYIGVSLGAAFGNRETDDSNSSNDEHIGHSAKIFAGYRVGKPREDLQASQRQHADRWHTFHVLTWVVLSRPDAKNLPSG